jgi:hypothetical protein
METQYIVQAFAIGIVGVLVAVVGYLTKGVLDGIKADLKTLVTGHSSQSGDIRVIQEQISQIKGELRAQDERSNANHAEVMLGRNRYHELAGKLQAVLAELRLLRGMRPSVVPPDDGEATG